MAVMPILGKYLIKHIAQTWLCGNFLLYLTILFAGSILTEGTVLCPLANLHTVSSA